MEQKTSKIERLEKQFENAKEKEKYFRDRVKTLKLQIEAEKAKALIKVVDEAGLNIEEAKTIIKGNAKETVYSDIKNK